MLRLSPTTKYSSVPSVTGGRFQSAGKFFVGFVEDIAVDEHAASREGDGFARQPDDAFQKHEAGRAQPPRIVFAALADGHDVAALRFVQKIGRAG